MPKDHPKQSAIMSSIRRTILRHAPSSVLDEMRPILHHNSSGGGGGGGATSSSTTNAAGKTMGDLKRNHEKGKSGGGGMNTMNHHHNTATDTLMKSSFEFSVRDHTDATAKRGFRVQIPKRILCYTAMVFVVLPVFLFVYVELHTKSKASAAAAAHHSPVQQQKQQYDLMTVESLSSLLGTSNTAEEEEEPPPPDESSSSLFINHDLTNHVEEGIGNILDALGVTNNSDDGQESKQQQQEEPPQEPQQQQQQTDLENKENDSDHQNLSLSSLSSFVPKDQQEDTIEQPKELEQSQEIAAAAVAGVDDADHVTDSSPLLLSSERNNATSITTAAAADDSILQDIAKNDTKTESHELTSSDSVVPSVIVGQTQAQDEPNPGQERIRYLRG